MQHHSDHPGHSASLATVVRRALSAILMTATITACDAADRIVVPDVVSTAVASTPPSRVAAFVAAQGTYCNDAVGIFCAPPEFLGIGYVYALCTIDCGTSITADFGGVNRRWWDARNLPSYPGAYSSAGTVTESVQQDGRRRLVVSIRAKNTFVAFYDQNLATLVGADFLEYPLIGSPSFAPLTGEATLQADLVLPAGYVGYPDVIEAVFDPTSGIEVRSVNTTATVEGRLRVDHAGIAAGTMVRVHGVSRSLLKLQARTVPSKRLIALAYDPTSRIDVKVIR